jgi:hypothetical protein
VSRVASAIMLSLHRVPATSTGMLLPTHASAVNSRVSHKGYSGKNLLIYLVLVQGTVQLAGPYFTPYMLNHLQLSYTSFTGLIAVAFVAKVASLAIWGQLARRRGAAWLLTVGGTAIVPLSLLWVVSQNLYWLIFIQIINGSAWAAYELGLFLMFFEALPLDRRVRMLTYYNLANASAWCVGAMLGAVLLLFMGTSVEAYYMLFALSSAGRFIAVTFLYATRSDLKVRVTRIGLRVLGLTVTGAPMEAPILPSIPDPE